MKLNGAILKRREVVGNMYIYTYMYPYSTQEIKIAKLIPTIEDLVIEGDNNHIVLPVAPKKIMIKGSNNTIDIEEPIIEVQSINKPSDMFDIEDYMRYREYMIKHGGTPSLSDYFKAIEYYKSRA